MTRKAGLTLQYYKQQRTLRTSAYLNREYFDRNILIQQLSFPYTTKSSPSFDL